LFQTVLPAVTFQLPLPGMMVAPSTDVVSQVRAAAKAEGAVRRSEMAATRNGFCFFDFMGDFWVVVLDLMVGLGDFESLAKV
jgi:hypothetical protein